MVYGTTELRKYGFTELWIYGIMDLRNYGLWIIFYVFAFADFTAWNATVGVEGEWRKLVYRQSPSITSDHLEKIEISKSIFSVFVLIHS